MRRRDAPSAIGADRSADAGSALSTRRVSRLALARGDVLRRQIDRAQEDACAQEREFGVEVALGNVSPSATTQAVRPIGPTIAAGLQ